MRTPRLALLVLLALCPLPLAAQDAPAPDKPKEESPAEKAARLAASETEVRGALESVLSPDVVERGRALERILAKRSELKELPIEDLLTKVRESGLTASDRFIAVLAGEILAELDPHGTVAWIKANALAPNMGPLARGMALAVLSEIPVEESVKTLCSFAAEGTEETRCQALIGLQKLRSPESYTTLAACLSAQEQNVKDNAAIALGKLGDPRAIPALLGRLEDATGDHPCFASWALQQFDDPRIFPAVAAGLKSDSGEPGDAKARLIEASARPEHRDQLHGILKQSRSLKFRYAAARALGRLSAEDEDSQKLLLAGLVKGTDVRLRWACFFGLARSGAKLVGPRIVEELKGALNARSDDQHAVLRMLAFLAGDLSLPEAAPILLNAARLHKNELTWRICAVNFFKCDAPEAHRKLKDDFDAASDPRTIERLSGIMARSTRVEEFRYLINQFRRFREGSAEAVAVELAVEQMTGHFFGPDYGLWRKWFEKNPDFFAPRVYRIDRRKWQSEFTQKDREFRQTEETERAVQLGLAWLARHQNLQGALDPNKFFDRCVHQPSCVKEGSRHMLDKIGTTSLAALAFLGGGYSPHAGKYKEPLARLLTYIEARQTADGNYTTTDRFQGYQRPIAIYALAEAFNITGDFRYERSLDRGISFLTEIQNEKGGWHYQADSRETDTSCMSWVLLGLGVAHKSGFPVRESVFEGCRLIMETCSTRPTVEREEYLDLDPAYSYDVGKDFRGEFQTGYQSTVHENATTSFGLMARMFLGYRRSHPFCIGSGNFILNRCMEEIPKGNVWAKYVSKNRFPSYAWYYGTLAMHQMGGHFFRRWNEVIKELLPNIQLVKGCDAGAWPVLNYDFVAGKAYSTAMGVLTLETYYRYKPFCEEGEPVEEPPPGGAGK
ncbi:MAG: HEAT repeat domain-containing protein [Planctomycetes bacterium]|nr:HEAT repeat domain-containing protein [Planctomycetota bacterium]